MGRTLRLRFPAGLRWGIPVAFASLLIGLLPAPALAQPANDDFPGTSISSVPFSDSVDTSDATTEPGEPFPSCGFNVGKTVWYEYTPAEDTTLQVSTRGSGFDTVVGVYTGPTRDALDPIDCNDDHFGKASLLQFEATGGTTYRFQLGGYNGAGGDLVVNFIASPAHDDFSDRTVVTDFPFLDETDTSAATTEPGEPVEPNCAPIGATVWYEFTPSSDFELVATTSGSDFDTVLVVYTGSTLSGLEEVACSDDTDFSLQARVRFQAQAGTTYQFQVGGYAGSEGNLVFRLRTGTSCSLAGGTMTIDSQEDEDFLSIGRTGGGEFTGSAARGSCAGATVEDVDQVVVSVSADADDGQGGDFQGLTIDLSSGPFAPGLTPETAGISEIEFNIDLGGGFDFLRIMGWGGPDAIRLGGLGNINLNGDDDTDVVLTEVDGLSINAGKGDDDVRATGGLGTGEPRSEALGVYGGPGHDVLAGGSDDDFLSGGGGSDQIAGRSGGDFVEGGGGSDDLDGNRGRDVLAGGSGADSLDGGRGVDRCRGGPGVDTLVRCEV
jgi:hypothetical protein